MGDIFGIGASVQGAAQATSAALNYKAQKDYNEKYLQGVKETNETNINLAREQNAWNKQQWLDEIAYNDPAKQVERLKGAGLSAAAAAQSLEGAGNAGPLQSADLSVAAAPGPLQAPQLDLSGMNIIGLARSLEDLKQSKINTETMQNELDIQPELLLTEQQIRERNLKKMEQDYEFAAKANPYSLRGFHYDVLMKEQQHLRNKLEYKIAKQNLKRARYEFGFIQKYNQKELEKIFVDIKNSFQDYSNKVAEGQNIVKQGKLLDQDYAKNEIMKAFNKYGGVPDNFAAKMAILIAEGVIKPEDVQSNIANFKEIQHYLTDGLGSTLGQGATGVIKGFFKGVKDSFSSSSQPSKSSK